MNVLSRDNQCHLRRLARVAFLAVFAILAVGATYRPVEAQTPVEGPWMEVDQVICFTNETGGDEECSNKSYLEDGITYEYSANYGQNFEYGKARRDKCYYKGQPEAHDVNGLYLMMSCRIGITVGGITWVGVGIALMGICWVGFRKVIESMGSSSGESSSLRNNIGMLVVGILLMFSAYPLSLLIQTVSKYNFLRYLHDPGMWP